MGEAARHGNDYWRGGLNQTIQAVIALGTGSVSTQTKIVGSIPKKCRITGIRFYGQAAVTGTSLTAQVHARTTAGAAGNDLCSAKDIKFASAAAAKTGVAATLESTNPEHLNLDEDQLLEVVITATSITAGPGDLLAEIEFQPRT